MRTIAFLSQKGGSGKTTLAVHAAVAATEARERVAVVDIDPQRSATVWSETREAETPVVVTASASELEKVIAAAKQDGMTLVLVDTAPHSAPEAARVASLVDLVVIPVRPSAFDMAAAAASVAIAKAHKVRAVMVLSACPSRSPEIVEAREALAGYDLPIFAGEITERRAFARAVASGRAVTEFESGGKAAQEIRSFWKWLKEKSK